MRLVGLYSKHNLPSIQLKVCRNGTIKIDLETNKIMDLIKFDVGNVVMVTSGGTPGV
jgi:ribosomal protein S4E